MNRRILITSVVVTGLMTAPNAHAVVCANNAAHTGCVAPQGTVSVDKMPVPPRPPVAHTGTGGAVTCANGVYRAGCKSPNGTAVERKPY